MKYTGLFLLLGIPLILAVGQGTTSRPTVHSDQRGTVVKGPSTEVELMKPESSQNQAGNSSSSHVHVETNIHSSTSTGTSSDQQRTNGSSATNQSSTSVTINGRDVQVPPSGELHKTFTGPDGSVSSVDVSVGGDGGDSTNHSSSVQVRVEGSDSN